MGSRGRGWCPVLQMLMRRHPWTARWGSLIDRCMDKAGEQEHSLIGTHRWDGPEGVVTEAVTDFVGWTQLASASKAQSVFYLCIPGNWPRAWHRYVRSLQIRLPSLLRDTCRCAHAGKSRGHVCWCMCALKFCKH